MAEGVLFNIAEGLIERLGSHAFQEIGLIWGVKDELHMLQQIVTQVKAVLLDSEQKQANNQIKMWLQSLEEVIYDADDVLDVFYCEGQRRKMVPRNNKISNQVCIFFSSSNQLAFRLKIGHKIKQIKERLDGIASLRTKFLFEERSEETQLITRGRETYSFVPMDKIIGRDEDKRAVIELLLDTNSEENVSTISIVGFGGLGKTALAQLVFNDEVVQKHFELKMWTCVSNEFELNIIVRKIIESATNKTPENLSIEQLQRNMREKIDRKKYLLVLDDVWNQTRQKWLGLKELLMGGAKGSRILITTRSKIVAEVSDTAKPYILRGLDQKQSWSLFKKMAFKEENEPENVKIKEIAEEVARKCGGVPLAIRTVGPMLFGKHEESDWLAFKNNKLSKISPEENGILPTLKLSYDFLPSHLKHCFAYCSLFPPDYEIDVEELVKLWMAQGFIKSSDQNECLEDVGYGYFKELLWRSFFQEETKDEFGMIVSCKMHDLMNELAISVSGTVSTIIGKHRENFDEKYRHVSLNFYVGLSKWKIPSSLLKANKIRSFLFLYGRCDFATGLNESFCNRNFSNFKSLRMLSLNDLGLRRVPKCLSKMKQLRYLNLSDNGNMTRLPNWIVKLENMQTLDLSYCRSLMELPRDLKNMINLRHLMLTDCFGLTHMPCGVGELLCLRTLDWFVLGRRQDKDCAGLGELEKLNELRGRLVIANLRHGKDVSKSNVAKIMNEKRHLASLTLGWSTEDNEVNMDDEDMSLEALQPHSNLKELVVCGYGGVKFASWLSLLENIINLKLFSLHRCKYLPPLDRLPCLKLLQLDGLYNLEYISDEGWGGSDASSSTSTLPFFPSLDKLILDGCHNLKGWWRPERKDQHPSFPCLSTLEIRGCPSLTSMPLYPSLDKELILKNTSLKPFEETMMMKMKNEDDNHTTSEHHSTTCSSLFLLLHPCFGVRGASKISSSSFSPLSKLKSLQIEKLDDKDIQGIGKFTSLVSLSIGDSPNLASLPEAIGDLSSLQTLTISECHNLTSLSKGIGKLSSLQRLTISGCHNLTSLPEGKGNLASLRELTVNNCNNLTSFPELIGNLKSLETIYILSLHNLTSLPEGIGNLASLQELTVNNCNNFTSFPESIGNLKSLETFQIKSMPNLTSLPEGIGNLASLRALKVDNCENLISLPQGLCRLTSLDTLELAFPSTLLRKRCKKETGEDWPKIAHIPNLLIWPEIENDSEPEDNSGGGGKILSAFKTLMHCN